jgi:steroid delta-isomerase-like uncharacterized protein
VSTEEGTEMSGTEMSDIVEQWAEAWSSGDIKEVLRLFTDDCVYEDVTLGVVNHGKDELAAFGEGFFAAAPDLRIELASHVVGGNGAAAEWWFKGTQQGELLGMPPTGRSFAFRGMSAFELDGGEYGGKIARCADYWDLETFKRQLGVID